MDLMGHGLAIAKKDIGDIIKKGDSGMITAYLPDMNKFAIYSSKFKWITFDFSETEFLGFFEISQ